MLVQAGQHMAATPATLNQVTARQDSQDSTFFHLSATMNQTIHVQARATFSRMPEGKEVRLQRLQMLKASLENEATSSKDSRSQAYAKLYERTINPESRSRNFLELPAARQGLAGGRTDNRFHEINQKEKEKTEIEMELGSLRFEVRWLEDEWANANAHREDVRANSLSNSINTLNETIALGENRLSILENELSTLRRDVYIS